MCASFRVADRRRVMPQGGQVAFCVAFIFKTLFYGRCTLFTTSCRKRRMGSRPLFLIAAIMRATSSVVSGWMPPARVHSFDDIEHAIAQQFGELSERRFLIHPARFVYSPRAGAHACELTHSGKGMAGTVCWTRRTHGLREARIFRERLLAALTGKPTGR